jgi:hypothetical protein
MNIEEVRKKIGELLKEYEDLQGGGKDYAISEEALRRNIEAGQNQKLKVLLELIDLWNQEDNMRGVQ